VFNRVAGKYKYEEVGVLLMKNRFMEKYENLLSLVQRPGRYIGGEINQIIKNDLRENKDGFGFP
jgi:hypothetical protein